MSDGSKAYAAAPAETLEQHITDSRIAKNDAEWWAHHEILRLRAENEKLRAILFQFAAYDDDYENDDSGAMTVITVPIGVIRAAAAALKETGE